MLGCNLIEVGSQRSTRWMPHVISCLLVCLFPNTMKIWRGKYSYFCVLWHGKTSYFMRIPFFHSDTCRCSQEPKYSVHTKHWKVHTILSQYVQSQNPCQANPKLECVTSAWSKEILLLTKDLWIQNWWIPGRRKKSSFVKTKLHWFLRKKLTFVSVLSLRNLKIAWAVLDFDFFLKHKIIETQH